MQKIKDSLLKALYRYSLSRLAFVILLDLVNFSDEKGRVSIYYKDIYALAHCSPAQFYNVLQDLEEVGIIHREKNSINKEEIVITIPGNDFVKTGYSNYVDINTHFFVNRLYKDLKAGEIRLYLYIFFRVAKQKKNVHIQTENKSKLFYRESYKTLSDKVGMSLRMTRHYAKTLSNKGYVCVGEKINISNKKYDVITLNRPTTQAARISVMEHGIRQEIKPNPLHLHWTYFIHNLCRRHKITADTDSVNDAAVLIGQYRQKAVQKGRDIYNVVSNAMTSLAGQLDSRILHNIIRSLIDLDYNDSIVVF